MAVLWPSFMIRVNGIEQLIESTFMTYR